MKRIALGNKLFMFQNVYYVLLYLMVGIFLYAASFTFIRREQDIEDDVSQAKKFTDGIDHLYRI